MIFSNSDFSISWLGSFSLFISFSLLRYSLFGGKILSERLDSLLSERLDS